MIYGETQEMEELKIREARNIDVDELVSLENECFDTYYREHKFSEVEFAEYLHKKKGIIFVATLNATIIGYVAGTVRTSLSCSSAHLDSIAVLRKARRTGVGGRLLHRFIDEAGRQDCKRILLEVAFVNEEGMAFFSNHSFRRVRSLPGYYGEGLSGVRMELDIDWKSELLRF